MVTKLRSLVEETGVGLIMVAHLRRLEGNRGHENGVTTSLSHLRGSQSIAQTSDVVIGLERDQQGDDRNTTTVRILKNRFSGMTGECCQLEYNEQTGRLIEVTTEASPNGDIY
jgi:twinkle protein